MKFAVSKDWKRYFYFKRNLRNIHNTKNEDMIGTRVQIMQLLNNKFWFKNDWNQQGKSFSKENDKVNKFSISNDCLVLFGYLMIQDLTIEGFYLICYQKRVKKNLFVSVV